MSSRWWPSAILRRADLRGDAVERAAAQPRAQRAHRPAFGDDALDDAVGVLLDDAERHAARVEVARQHVGRKARLLLVEVDRDHLERERRAVLEREQDVEQAVAVLAAGQADHHAVAAARSVRSRRSLRRPGGAGASGACSPRTRPCAGRGATAARGRAAAAAGSRRFGARVTSSMAPLSFYRRGRSHWRYHCGFRQSIQRRLRCRRSSSPIRKAAAARRRSRPMSPAGSRASGSGSRCADLDPQRSSTEWLAAASGAVSARSSARRRARRRTISRDADPQWLVVDTPAGMHGDELRDAMRRADVMLVPLTPSAFDMAATAHFLEAIHDYKAVKRRRSRSASSRCGSTPRTRSAAELDAFLRRLRVSARRASARHAGLRALRARRRVGLRSAAIARRAGLGAVEAADALDRASRLGERRMTGGRKKRRRRAGVLSS